MKTDKTPPKGQRTAIPASDVGETGHFRVTSIVSARTKEGLVEMTLNDATVQMDLSKAREIVDMLQGAIEAAISDALLVQFLTKNIGLPVEAAGRALLDFREMRQGSRESVMKQ